MYFLRSICGIRKKTLIINLFGFYKEEAITCIDVIVTIMEDKYTKRLAYEKNKEKLDQATTSSLNQPSTSSSSNDNTDWVRFFMF